MPNSAPTWEATSPTWESTAPVEAPTWDTTSEPPPSSTPASDQAAAQTPDALGIAAATAYGQRMGGPTTADEVAMAQQAPQWAQELAKPAVSTGKLLAGQIPTSVEAIKSMVPIVTGTGGAGLGGFVGGAAKLGVDLAAHMKGTTTTKPFSQEWWDNVMPIALAGLQEAGIGIHELPSRAAVVEKPPVQVEAPPVQAPPEAAPTVAGTEGYARVEPTAPEAVPTAAEAVPPTPEAVTGAPEPVPGTPEVVPAAEATVPVMITRQMEADLRGMGYEQSAIDKMTPQQANDILRPAPPEPAPPEAAPPAAAEAPPQAAEPPQVGEAVAPAAPAEVPVRGTQADVAVAREQVGLDPYERDLEQSWGQAADISRQKVARYPGYEERLAQEIDKKPRPVTSDEHVSLLRNWQQAEVQYQRAVDAVNSSPDATARGLAETARAVAKNRLEEAVGAVDKSGSAAGRGFNIRKMILKDFYSPERMAERVRAAKGGKALNATEVAQVEQHVNEMRQARVGSAKVESQRAADARYAEKANGSVGEKASKARTMKDVHDILNAEAEAARQRIVNERGSTKWTKEVEPCIL